MCHCLDLRVWNPFLYKVVVCSGEVALEVSDMRGGVSNYPANLGPV